MLNRIVATVMWVGKASVFLVGLAVMLVLVLSVSSVALAGTGVGANFHLGKKNTVNRLSQLVGSTDNAMLRIVNSNAGNNATALDLQVEAGSAPMKVNSGTRVDNLNADFLDDRSASAFLASNTYRRGQGQERLGTAAAGGKVLSQSCDSGDRLLAGGPASVAPASHVLDSFPLDFTTWQVRINDSALADPGDEFTVVVLCANQ